MCAGAGHAQGLYLKPTRVLGQVAEIHVHVQDSSWAGKAAVPVTSRGCSARIGIPILSSASLTSG